MIVVKLIVKISAEVRRLFTVALRLSRLAVGEDLELGLTSKLGSAYAGLINIRPWSYKICHHKGYAGIWSYRRGGSSTGGDYTPINTVGVSATA